MQNDIIKPSPARECDSASGSLPPCAPLAVPFVARQQGTDPAYEADKALMRGTLFPGLDLPFKNVVNAEIPDSPAKELMELDFVTHELALYLDTHPDDAEAFRLYQEFLKLAEEGKSRYTQMFGPLLRGDMLGAGSFTWVENPWPWQYTNEGRR